MKKRSGLWIWMAALTVFSVMGAACSRYRMDNNETLQNNDTDVQPGYYQDRKTEDTFAVVTPESVRERTLNAPLLLPVLDGEEVFQQGIDKDLQQTKSDTEPFSIVWMTDTQKYTRNRIDVLDSMKEWILSNKEERNIVFVAHTGDVVDGFSEEMWKNAEDFLQPILIEIPGAIASGNHDIAGKKQKHTYFLERSYAKQSIIPEQAYLGGQAYYHLLSVGDKELIIFAIGYLVTDQVWPWILDVMQQHPDAIAIFLMHHGMEENGTLSGQAKQLEKHVVMHNSKARILLSGHLRGTAFRQKVFSDNEGKEYPFYAMMYNYQDDYSRGCGFLRILTFYPETGHVSVETYSPVLDRYGYYKTPVEKDHFIIENIF